MRLDYLSDLRSMLAAKGASPEPGGGGSTELTNWLASTRPKLPRVLQRLWPVDFASALVLLAFAWTAFTGLGTTYLAITSFATNGSVLDLTLPLALIGIAGIWYGPRWWTLGPASVFWLALVPASLTEGSRGLWISVACGASLAAGGFWVYQRRLAKRAQSARYKASVNRLGWDLLALSTASPPVDETVSEVRVCRELRVGELERHFDQVTSASIQGQMQHAFRMSGSSSSIHDLPLILLRDTQTFTTLGGSGMSQVQLGLSGVSSDDLTSDAFVAVFEQVLADGTVDTIRAVVPSERQARGYVDQLLNAWALQLGPDTGSEATLRKYSGAISRAVVSESSYVGDRLAATLRMPASDRPAVTLIGEPLGPHAILAGAVRFGVDGPLYQLFPVALVQALLALMAGKALPSPPPSSKPTAAQPVASEDETITPLVEASPTSPNGHRPHLTIHTLGGLRLTGQGEDLTSALIDRKVLAFLWLYLLARRLRNPHDTITRASLADELSPGLDRSTQRSRLRGRLSELRNELPAAIGKRLEVSGERINLDLTDCDVDLQRLLEVAGAFAKANGLLSAEQLAQLESVVSDANGTFLPDWDDLELHVNSGKGGAGEVVADLRHQVEVARVAILRALGDGYLAHAKPEAAVTLLERALNAAPDDESVARSLIAACLQSGRLARAEELRKDFSQ